TSSTTWRRPCALSRALDKGQYLEPTVIHRTPRALVEPHHRSLQISTPTRTISGMRPRSSSCPRLRPGSTSGLDETCRNRVGRVDLDAPTCRRYLEQSPSGASWIPSSRHESRAVAQDNGGLQILREAIVLDHHVTVRSVAIESIAHVNRRRQVR